MGWYPYWKKIPADDVQRYNAEADRKGHSTRMNPYWGVEGRHREADARAGVMRDVLGFDDGDLDEDGHALDGSAVGACRIGLVVNSSGRPMDMSEWEARARYAELEEVGEIQSLYGGGYTHPDFAPRLARRKRWGRPRRWGR